MNIPLHFVRCSLSLLLACVSLEVAHAIHAAGSVAEPALSATNFPLLRKNRAHETALALHHPTRGPGVKQGRRPRRVVDRPKLFAALGWTAGIIGAGLAVAGLIGGSAPVLAAAAGAAVVAGVLLYLGRSELTDNAVFGVLKGSVEVIGLIVLGAVLVYLWATGRLGEQ